MVTKGKINIIVESIDKEAETVYVKIGKSNSTKQIKYVERLYTLLNLKKFILSTKYDKVIKDLVQRNFDFLKFSKALKGLYSFRDIVYNFVEYKDFTDYK